MIEIEEGGETWEIRTRIADFKIGDTVRSVKDCISDNDDITKGMLGTVVHLMSGTVGVQWEMDVGGHACSNNCPDGYGWYVFPEEVEVLVE